jgi:UDP-glucose 4-epimerase
MDAMTVERVLVTGGLGMVGAFMCRALLANGYRPVIYDAATSTALVKDVIDQCDRVQASVTDLPAMLEAARTYRPVAIFHFGALVGPRVEQTPWNSINVNLMGTMTALECARLADIPRVLFASSKMVYGPVLDRHRHPRYDPVEESHPREPEKLYGKLKRSCEELGAHYANTYHLDVTALRFGSAYAPGKFGTHDKVSPVMGIIEAAIANRPFEIASGGDQRDDLCYSAESANGALAVLKTPLRPRSYRAYNIASGELISLKEMALILKELYPRWEASIGDGVDYRNSGTGYYFLMSTRKAQEEIAFRPLFDFRRAAIDYAETVRRLA